MSKIKREQWDSIGFRILERKRTPNISSLIHWIKENLSKHETMDIHQWIGEAFYIVVEDIRLGWKYPEDIRIGFTVDIDRDLIMWSKKSCRANENGGNCFVRTSKWKGLLKKRFGYDITEKVYFYPNVYLPKSRKV
jgi:hypothetical protein